MCMRFVFAVFFFYTSLPVLSICTSTFQTFLSLKCLWIPLHYYFTECLCGTALGLISFMLSQNSVLFITHTHRYLSNICISNWIILHVCAAHFVGHLLFWHIFSVLSVIRVHRLMDFIMVGKFWLCSCYVRIMCNAVLYVFFALYVLFVCVYFTYISYTHIGSTE